MGKYTRKEWLTKGDRNSKFFHRTADSRRRKKRVIRIKDDCDLWIDNQACIAQKFIADYTLRYKSENLRKRILPSLGLAKMITDSDNIQLLKLPDYHEIKDA